MTFGERIRELRMAHKMPLRTVAAELDIDQAILSKIERSQKRASRKHVMKLSAFFTTNSNDLLVARLSDKLVDE
jgi:HTH-type transcriptional regulator, competence development regulator